MKTMLAALLCALSTLAPASAASIVYTTTGSGSALVDGVVYSGAFTETATADTSVDYNPTAAITAFLVDSLKITIGGITVSTNTPTLFFTNVTGLPIGTIAGYVQYDPVTNSVANILAIGSPQFAGYDPATAIGPIAVNTLSGGSARLTDHGAFSWIATPVYSTFTATPAPEPGAWAVMVVGFGAIGIALRRRTITVARHT